MKRPLSLLAAFLIAGSPCSGWATDAAGAIALSGSPQAIGQMWGEVNAEAVKTDVQKSFLEPAGRIGLTKADLVRKGRRFVEICSEVAPHWLEEASAIARTAGVDPDLYASYIGTVYRSLFMGDECTSYAVSPKYAEGNGIFFHKNRDNKAKPQAACIVESDIPGINKFITVSDSSVLTCMMMVNEKGLAGSADMGGRLGPGTPKFGGVMNTFLLRHVAERAASCTQALEIVQDFVEKGFYAGGDRTGTHWLFVDATGAVLEVSNNADEVVSQFHDEKVYFSARENTEAARRLRDHNGPVDFHSFHNVSRDPSICFQDSISGMTVEIDRLDPDLFTCAWFTFPAKGLAFPLLMGGTTTPRSMMNGEVYSLSKDIDNSRTAWEPIEENCRENKDLLIERVLGVISEDSRDRATERIDEWVLETAEAQTNMLRLLNGGEMMSDKPVISFPRDGDVLTRNDGVETEDCLTVTVRGTVPAGRAVTVNGRDATVEGSEFSCPIPLSKKRSIIAVESGDVTNEIQVFWNKGSRKRYRFSSDDNIFFLKDLGTQPEKYESLFDHWYLGFWKEMHEEFGTKTHINIYYQTEGFDLTQMPDKWRDEWRENSPWLHLSFHALQNEPDRPYRNAVYSQVAHDYDLICGHIRRFAGNECLSNTTTVHWAECPKRAIGALRDRGIENLIALFNYDGEGGRCTTGYYHSQERCNYCDTRGAWYDRDTDLTFVRCAAVVNTLEVEEIMPYLDARTSTPETAEMLELLIHEQYFRKEHPLYQPTILDKVRTSIKWASDRGYEPVFWGDGYLGTVEE